MKKHPKWVKFREAVSGLWITIAIDQIVSVHGFSANGFSVQLSSGHSWLFHKREHDRLLRYMQASGGIH